MVTRKTKILISETFTKTRQDSKKQNKKLNTQYDNKNLFIIWTIIFHFN